MLMRVIHCQIIHLSCFVTVKSSYKFLVSKREIRQVLEVFNIATRSIEVSLQTDKFPCITPELRHNSDYIP